MISFDTNILFAALESTADDHGRARAFLAGHQENDQVALCELSLLELYTLLRNPTICAKPLSASAAAQVIQSFRRHPAWRLVDYASQVADNLWRIAGDAAFTYRRVYVARLALTLRHHGVTEFATRDVRDFQGFGFTKVWDPLGK